MFYQPKKPFNGKTLRIVLGIIAIAVFASAIGVWASTQLSVTNSATIHSGANILMSQPVFTTFSSCAGATYTASPSTLSWTIVAGSSNSTFFCIENIGTSSTLGTFTLTLGTATGLSSATTSYSALGAGASTSSPVTYSISATSTATSGTFTVTVG